MRLRLTAALLALVMMAMGSTGGQTPTKKAPAPGKAAAAVELPFSGTWVGTYSSNQSAGTKITLMIQQFGTTVTGTYLIPAMSAQGVLFGKVRADGSGGFDVDQKTPECPGHFAMEASIKGKQMTFTFKGSHCAGQENGSGKATKGPEKP
jgi:hypothetical protein